MGSVSQSRIDGINTSVAVKAPVHAVATTNIVLSGLQTVGGVVLDGNLTYRVLLPSQTNPVENGIYDASTGSWTRSDDFDDSRDVVVGTLVPGVYTSNTLYYRVAGTNPIIPGTSSITFPDVFQLSNASQILSTGVRYIRTQAEINAGVIPVDYSIPSHLAAGKSIVDRYQTNTTPGTTDMSTGWANAILVASTAGGGIVSPLPGVTYMCTTAPVLKAGVYIEGGWARLNLQLGAGNVFGLRVVSNSGVDKLKVYTTVSTSPSSQYIFHAPISFGAPNNNGDSIASPDPFQTAHDFYITNVELGNVRDFGPVIQGMGDAYNFKIDGVYIPDSSTCSGIHLDWGNIGTISSSAIATTRTAFDSNLCRTTHPHSGKITNVNAGTLSKAVSSDQGSFLVRLSGCYGIEVDEAIAESVTWAGYMHTGGDPGFEFASATDKRHAYKNNTCRHMTLRNTVSLYGAYIDTLGDNIYREQFINSYAVLANPLWHGNIVVEDNNFSGANASGTAGIRVIQGRGVKLNRNTCQLFEHGIYIDEQTQDISFTWNDCFANRIDGIRVGTQALRENTERITGSNNNCYGNGTVGTGYGINVLRCRTGWFDDNTLGTIDEATQDIGLFVADNSVNYNVNVRRNHCLGSTTAAYGCPGSAAPYYYNQIGEWDSNTAELSNPQAPIIASQSQIPIKSLEFGSRWARAYLSNVAGSPSQGHWYRGSKIYQTDSLAANPDTASVTTSGTFGTLAGLTNAATTNGSKDITCSLAARTATSTLNTYSIVVSSATNLRIGLKVSVAAAGLTDARIIDISGTTLQLDIPAKITQAGGAFTTAGLVEGEVISIDTTAPIAGAVVMKIVGTTVTLDTAPTNTQSGRTLSYTAPVFKNHANIAA